MSLHHRFLVRSTFLLLALLVVAITFLSILTVDTATHTLIPDRPSCASPRLLSPINDIVRYSDWQTYAQDRGLFYTDKGIRVVIELDTDATLASHFVNSIAIERRLVVDQRVFVLASVPVDLLCELSSQKGVVKIRELYKPYAPHE